MPRKSYYCWGLVILLVINILGEITLLELYFQSTSEDQLHNSKEFQSFCDVPQLKSSQPLSLNESNTKSINSLVSVSSEKDQSSGSTGFTSKDIEVLFPSFQINGDPSLNITKISPEAMEINASSMPFILNFTIPGEFGLEFGTLVNLTLNNVSHNLLITSYASTDWVELTNETGYFIDRYSLTFTLNNSFLSSIAFGSYDLSMYIDVAGYLSSDSVPLPMRDLWVNIIRVTPFEFNIRYDSDQFFIVEIEVRNYTSSSSFYYVDFIPAVIDVNGSNVNPRATVKSVPPSDTGFLQFQGFTTNNTSQGRFALNYSLPASVAQEFDEGDHQLIISVTTLEWISDEASTQFTAKETVYLVILDELTVESNPALSYDDLTAGSQDDIIFRLNVNDSINITFHVYDTELNITSERSHDIGYQNPNKPEDPTALLYDSTNEVGVGSITLTANDVTPSSGFTLLFFVKGHRTSQESDKPSNITIFWDLLYYTYTYYDKLSKLDNSEGTNLNPNNKSLVVDVHEDWVFEFRVFYMSDDSPALGGNISYSFDGGSPTYLRDGDLDGLFNISYSYSGFKVADFECQIISGSSFDPQGTFFVNKTIGASKFNLTVIWTYLIIEMISGETDGRLSTLATTYIYLNATWAHDANLAFDDNLVVRDHFWSTQRTVLLSANEGTYTGLVNINTDSYRYSVVAVLDKTFGITKFTNSSIIDFENPQVQVDIIWESIEFTYSNIYNSSLSPDNQTWGVESFFANYGENTTLYIYGRHSYDNSPFNGIAVLYEFDSGTPYEILFINGIGNWTGDLSTAGLPVFFSVMEIKVEYDYGILSVGTIDGIIISWDKIVITLEANLAYSHGTWADVYVTFNYLIYDSVPVDPSNVTYDVVSSDGSIMGTNVSLTYFRDFSYSTIGRTYYITNIFDARTGLSQAEVRFRWLDQNMDPESGDLTIYWIDDKDPIIVELRTYDLGNGSLIIVLDVIDDSEQWIGSGIATVELFDERELVQAPFPLEPGYILLPSGIHRYYFKYSYNQWIDDPLWIGNEDYFQFEYGELLIFTLRITDHGTPDFPEVLGNLRNPRTITVDSFTVTPNFDPYRPGFISKNGTDITVFYPNLDEILTSKPNITDGDVIVTVYIQDSIWSGIDRKSVQIIVIDTINNFNFTDFMTITNDSAPLRAELQFNWAGTLTVGGTYQLIVIITDNAGNTNTRTVEVTIEDHLAPRIEEITITETDDRRLKID
ncbi:MAG: hypothetical protein ACFFDT_14210, partial [Candidatus Hodarchaeota archaeon]